MGELFGTDGIRGEAGIYPITHELAVAVGRALAVVLREHGRIEPRVVTGMDTRPSGEMLSAGITEGLLSTGAHVLSAGIVPTPAVALLTRSLNADAGVVLTASHNPCTDNGIKIFDRAGLKLHDRLEKRIEAMILGKDRVVTKSAAGRGELRSLNDAGELYMEFAAEVAGEAGGKLDGLKIVLDCANGAGYRVAPRIFRRLGARVLARAVRPNGRNINMRCGALYPENAGRVVVGRGADAGISLDGDGDRVIFTDDNGAVVDGDRILAICALDLLSRGRLSRNTLVATTMSNLGLHDAMARHGITVETTAVGDRYVGERMREGGYNLGGEKSGHVIFLDHATTGDGILTAIHVLGMLKRSGRTMHDLADCMEEYPQKLTAVPVREKVPIENLPELSSAVREGEEALGAKGRIVVRYSGTERKLRILVEARDPGAVDYWTTRLTETARREIGQ